MIAASDIKTALRAVIAIAVLAAALVLPGQAVAAGECDSAGSDPTAAQYCSPSEVTPAPVEEESEVRSESSESSEESSETESVAVESAPASSGSLPFTGLDLIALVAVAGALTAAGLALYRLSRPRTHAN